MHESESANTILTPFRQLAAHKPPRPLFPPVAKTGHRPSSPCSLTVPINVKQSLLHMQCCRLHFDANIFGVVSDKPEYCHTFCSCQGQPPSRSFTTHAEPLGGATRVLRMSLSRWRGMSAGGMFWAVLVSSWRAIPLLPGRRRLIQKGWRISHLHFRKVWKRLRDRKVIWWAWRFEEVSGGEADAERTDHADP